MGQPPALGRRADQTTPRRPRLPYTVIEVYRRTAQLASWEVQRCRIRLPIASRSLWTSGHSSTGEDGGEAPGPRVLGARTKKNTVQKKGAGTSAPFPISRVRILTLGDLGEIHNAAPMAARGTATEPEHPRPHHRYTGGERGSNYGARNSSTLGNRHTGFFASPERRHRVEQGLPTSLRPGPLSETAVWLTIGSDGTSPGGRRSRERPQSREIGGHMHAEEVIERCRLREKTPLASHGPIWARRRRLLLGTAVSGP